MIPIQILFYFFNFLGKLLVVATILYFVFHFYLLYPAEKDIEYAMWK